MRLAQIAGLLATLVVSVKADSMTIIESCGGFGGSECTRYNSYFFTDFGAYKFNAKSECYTFGVPGMYEFCFDAGKGRAHFRFDHQGGLKRCMIQRSTSQFNCSALYCYEKKFEEVACNWLVADPGELENNATAPEFRESSALPEATSTAVPVSTG